MSSLKDSEISQTLDVANAGARYDAAARKLVAQKSILAYILKSTMDEFADVPVERIAEELIEDFPSVSEMAVFQDTPDILPAEKRSLSGSSRIHDMPTEDVSVREGTVRYDIRFLVRLPHDEERIEIIVNIEIQNKDKPGYPLPKRGIYYGSRMVSAQRGTIFKDQEYGKIKKVVSIWICENTAVSRSDSINEYLFTERCRRGEYREEKSNYDLMRIIVMRLGAEGENSEDDAIRLLSSMFSPRHSAEDKKKLLSEKFHINVTEEIGQEVSQMCNLSTGIFESGMEKGIEKGMEKGIEKGTLETLFALVKKGLLSVTNAAQQVNMEPAVFEEKYRAFYG